MQTLKVLNLWPYFDFMSGTLFLDFVILQDDLLKQMLAVFQSTVFDIVYLTHNHKYSHISVI